MSLDDKFKFQRCKDNTGEFCRYYESVYCSKVCKYYKSRKENERQIAREDKT